MIGVARAVVIAVCVGQERILRFSGGQEEPSAIDKRPVDGRIAVGPLGLDGDTQVARQFHGGVDRAVYAYADDDADHWIRALSRPIAPGGLGENLRLRGLAVSSARIGERWRFSSGLVLEVTAPRTPCRKLQGFLDVPDMIGRFISAGRPGAYLRVLENGTVAAGDRIKVSRDADAEAAPTVAEVMAWRSGAIATSDLRRLAGLDTLAADLRRWATETLAER
jgi:MOSC domain-containing protein YiiM